MNRLERMQELAPEVPFETLIRIIRATWHEGVNLGVRHRAKVPTSTKEEALDEWLEEPVRDGYVPSEGLFQGMQGGAQAARMQAEQRRGTFDLRKSFRQRS